MIRSIPSYIDHSGIADLTITTDGGGDYDKITSNDSTSKKFYELIGGMSSRAAWALTTGMAEWTIWRYGNYEEYPAAFLFTEATWAGLIDYRYLKPWMAGIVMKMACQPPTGSTIRLTSLATSYPRTRSA